jgi:hypothetical protein
MGSHADPLLPAGDTFARHPEVDAERRSGGKSSGGKTSLNRLKLIPGNMQCPPGWDAPKRKDAWVKSGDDRTQREVFDCADDCAGTCKVDHGASSSRYVLVDPDICSDPDTCPGNCI